MYGNIHMPTSQHTEITWNSQKVRKLILHAIVLDIKVYYYTRNALFHEATELVEYYYST